MYDTYTDFKNTQKSHTEHFVRVDQWHIEDSTFRNSQIIKYADLQKGDFDQDQRLDKAEFRLDEQDRNFKDIVLPYINKH